MNAPAFQFYVQDFLTGTMHLSAEEVGAYILLLCHQWDKGALPVADKDLLRIARTRQRVLDAIKSKFEICEDGQLRNKRLETERAKQIAYREQRRENANKRWKPKDIIPDTTALQLHITTQNKPGALLLAGTNNYAGKKTRIGTKVFEKSPSQLVVELFEQGITELMMGPYRALQLDDVMAEVETQCPSGTIFTNEAHLLNKFKAIAAKMLAVKKEKPAKSGKYDYSQYKRG